jgi:fused signal recognition particle receptor
MFNLFKKNPPSEEPVIKEPAKPQPSFTERLKQGLAKTRKQFGSQVAGLFSGGKIDAEVYEELETILLTSDVGVNATANLLTDIKSRVKRQNLDDTVQLKTALKASLTELLLPLQQPLNVEQQRPFVIMLAGVNGAGKTTTIGKLAHAFQAQGKSVLIAAGDTFRAAA